MTDLHELDAHAMAGAMERGETTSVELVEHHLARIEQHDAELGAFVTVTAEQALEAARAADEARRTTPADGRPPLLGVPTAIKDLTPTAGVRTTLGSRLMADHVPDVDAHVVTLMRLAGLVSLGKTNTPELGLSSYTDNDVVGPARTPWDLERTAGGSSGGAAAAVSAGFVPLAQGSDGGGSIRIPASCCGVFGFKPSRGRVSAGPTGSDWSGLVGDGPIARTVLDAAALLDALAHPMAGDPRPVPLPAEPFTSWAERRPERLRVARWVEPSLPGVAPSASSAQAWEHATEVLRSLGHEVVDVADPFPPELEPQFNVVWSSGVAAAPLHDEDLERLRPTTRSWLERGRGHSAADLVRALEGIESATRVVVASMAGYDAWLTPTLALPPQPVGWYTESGDPGEDHRRALAFTPYTAVHNMAGVPAASLPLSVVDGLPVGVMLAGRPGEDGPLFSLCAQVEEADPWRGRRPPVFA